MSEFGINRTRDQIRDAIDSALTYGVSAKTFRELTVQQWNEAMDEKRRDDLKELQK